MPSAYSNAWTERIALSEFFFGKPTGFQPFCVCVGDGGMLVVGVGVSKYVGVLMRFEW